MESLLLDTIDQPSDLKKLNAQQVEKLCAEIRHFLLKNISKTGGHLASNLGTVELTVALHRVLETPKDKIVFDVGHQCYTHKLLTGRRKQFDHLRQLDGISGFPNPHESVHDAFIAGHGNTALSLAIGMAWAKKIKHEPGLVVAVILCDKSVRLFERHRAYFKHLFRPSSHPMRPAPTRGGGRVTRQVPGPQLSPGRWRGRSLPSHRPDQLPCHTHQPSFRAVLRSLRHRAIAA